MTCFTHVELTFAARSMRGMRVMLLFRAMSGGVVEVVPSD